LGFEILPSVTPARSESTAVETPVKSARTLNLVPVMAVRASSVAILGLGYVGLPTALALLESGTDVIGIEIDSLRLAAIRSDHVDLSPLDHGRLAKALRGPGLSLSMRSIDLARADTVIVAVPTPVDEYLVPDLSALEAACSSVVAAARPGQTIVLTSTSYVGCTRDLLVKPLGERGMIVGRDVFVAYSPERIDPGNTKYAQSVVPRVVGGVTPECVRRAAEILRRIAPVHEVNSVEAAEMAKLIENTFRAVNIALANEFASVGQALGLDIMEVIEAASTKPFGFMPFYPGPGVGGHCIPCDPYYLLWQPRAKRVPTPLIDQAMTSIMERPGQVVRRAENVLSDARQGLRGSRVIVVGAAYKPGVADLRESSALPIIASLRERGAQVAYIDSFIPSLRLRDGSILRSVGAPRGVDYDLVIVHTLHPDTDLRWIVDAPLVLDATYRLPKHTRTAVV
jgi:UDP-N-acetyl-D-glucosamine dehydrogenase